jgi:hypothetical protein
MKEEEFSYIGAISPCVGESHEIQPAGHALPGGIENEVVQT